MPKDLIPDIIQKQHDDNLKDIEDRKTGNDQPLVGLPKVSAPEPAQPATPPAPIPAPEATAEERYKSLQGKYNAEMEKLHEEMRTVKAQISAKDEVIEMLKNQVTNPPKPEDTRPPHLRHLSDEDLEDIDTSDLELQSRVARGVVEAAIDERMKAMEKENQAVKDELMELKKSRSMDKVGEYEERVLASVPDAAEIDKTDELTAFLRKETVIAGQTFNDLLQRAQDELDAMTVINIFKMYKEQNGTPRSPDQPHPDQPPTIPPRVSATVSLPAEDNKKFIKQSSIDEFTMAVAQGAFSGTAEDMAAIQEEIAIAGAEGRIIPNQ
jgi:hypothetical protein